MSRVESRESRVASNPPHSTLDSRLSTLLPLILASASPRRLALLAQIGLTPDAVDPPHLNEYPLPGELPLAHVERLAREKAEAVAARHPGAAVLAADTVVTCGRHILPKAETREAARLCLSAISGRRHRVITSVCVKTPGRTGQRTVTTLLRCKRLTHAELAAYLDSGEWEGKAGGYALQGRAAAFFPWIGGSYSAVVGLPLYETQALLVGLGALRA